MKKLTIPALSLCASLLTAQAQYYSPTNLVVVQQVITPTTGSGVNLVQVMTNGTVVNTTALPSSGANSFILSTSITEGFVTLSANSNLLVLGGYAGQPGSSPSGATSTNVPRAVATVDAYNNYALPIKNSHIYSVANIRGAASDGVGNFWTSGSGGTGATITNGELGIIYVGTATAPTNITVALSGTANERCLDIFNGNLYFDTGSVTHGIFEISNVANYYPETAIMLTNAGITNSFPQAGSGSGPYAFQINAAGTLAYLADDNLGGIVKLTSPGNGNWTSNYTISVFTTGATGSGATNAFGCAVDFSQSPAVIYATSGEASANRLLRIVDIGASATATLLATAPANTAWRGLRFGPQLYGYVSVPPVAFSGNPGDTATFSVTAAGNPTPTIQWFSNSVANPTYVAIPGATSSTLSLPGITQGQSGSLFYVVVTNVYGSSTSAPVALTVQNPAITAQPVGATNFPGTAAVSLCVSAAGTGTLSYQWLSNGVPISGAQSSCYSAPSSSTSNTTSYSVIVSNTVGASSTSVTSSATVVSYSPYLLYDTFSYPNGNLFGDAGSPWTDINGGNPELVINDRVQIAQTNGTTDAQSLYTMPAPLGTVVWASFTLNVSTIPSNPGGVYFANFEDTNFGFYGRVFILTSNAPSLTPGISSIAYPGTYRLGIANNQNDSTSTSTNGPTAVVSLDLSPGIDYQVVAYYDITYGDCQLAINPSPSEATAISSSEGTYNGTGNASSALTSGPANDTFTANGLPMDGFGLRQRTGEGIMQMDNLEVSYDYSSAYSGYAAVSAGYGFTPAAPVIGLLTPGVTNYSGNGDVLEVAASGIDLGYQWYQNGVALQDGNGLTGSLTPSLAISPEVGTNSGTYTVVISNTALASLAVTSAPVVVSINTTAQAPSFTLPGGTQPPATASISQGGSTNFTAIAVGTGPITYQWYFNNGSSTVMESSTTTNLVLSGLLTNNSGSYYLVATGPSQSTTSSPVVLTVNGPVVANIGYIRSLYNAATYTASDTTTYYSITGVVTTATNTTTGNTSSCWIQDATGGINLFVEDGSDFRPQLGDLVTATGTLSPYDDNLQFFVTEGASGNVDQDLSTNNPLPAPILMPWGMTPPLTTSFATNLGSVVMLTNLYFEAYTNVGSTFATGTAYVVSNNAGLAYTVVTSDQDTNLVTGQPMPKFATSIAGPLTQNSAGTLEIVFTVYTNLVVPSTTPPITITNLVGMLASGGTGLTLNWAAVPTTSTYSVRSSTNAQGPYNNVLVSGLTFPTTAGTYTAPITNTVTFYEISSP